MEWRWIVRHLDSGAVPNEDLNAESSVLISENPHCNEVDEYVPVATESQSQLRSAFDDCLLSYQQVYFLFGMILCSRYILLHSIHCLCTLLSSLQLFCNHFYCIGIIFIIPGKLDKYCQVLHEGFNTMPRTFIRSVNCHSL